MLSIGEFSKICKVSAKTLRYYAEIGLLAPNKINSENGYRYYSIEQLKTMLFISRLKEYSFSLEEIKSIINLGELSDEVIYPALLRKKEEIEKKIYENNNVLQQLNNDMEIIRQGKSIMTYLEEIEIQLVDVPLMRLLSIRKMVQEYDYPMEYSKCYEKLFRKIAVEHLTMTAPPMVLFHSAEFSPLGLDTEFAIPVKEYVTGTSDFHPKLCLKTTVKGMYSNLPSVYAKHMEWIEKEGYEYSGALYEVYVNEPNSVNDKSDLITEVYSPIRKI